MIQALVEAKNAGIILSNKTLIELSGLQISADEEAGRLSVEPVETDQEIV